MESLGLPPAVDWQPLMVNRQVLVPYVAIACCISPTRNRAQEEWTNEVQQEMDDCQGPISQQLKNCCTSQGEGARLGMHPRRGSETEAHLKSGCQSGCLWLGSGGAFEP